MTVYQIIDTLNNFIPISEDDEEKNNESYFSQIMEFIKNKEDLELTIEPIFSLIEKYPLTDFGMPGPFIHKLESFIGYYENYLFESLQRRPTQLTILMLNRIINGEQNIIIKQNLIDRLQSYSDHPLLDEESNELIKDFVEYQNEINKDSN